MTDSPSKRLGRISAPLGIVVLVLLFVSLKWLRGPKNVFVFASIVCQIPEDCYKQQAKLTAQIAEAQSKLMRAHSEMIGLTLVALAFLYFLFSRNGIPAWTKYLLTTAAAASLAACWWQW